MNHTMSRFLLFVSIILLISGCSAGLTPDLSTGLSLAGDGRSLVANNETFSIKVAIYDQYLNIGTDDVYISFLINVKNLSSKPQRISKSSFYLLDQNSRQYQPHSSQQLMDIVESRYNYMLPYPFVGYYYSTEGAFPSFIGAPLSDSDPYRLFKTSTQFDTMILPGANVEGVLYFPLDTSKTKSVQLQIYSSSEEISANPEFSFPFSVEK